MQSVDVAGWYFGSALWKSLSADSYPIAYPEAWLPVLLFHNTKTVPPLIDILIAVCQSCPGAMAMGYKFVVTHFLRLGSVLLLGHSFVRIVFRCSPWIWVVAIISYGVSVVEVILPSFIYGSDICGIDSDSGIYDSHFKHAVWHVPLLPWQYEIRRSVLRFGVGLCVPDLQEHLHLALSLPRMDGCGATIYPLGRLAPVKPRKCQGHSEALGTLKASLSTGLANEITINGLYVSIGRGCILLCVPHLLFCCMWHALASLGSAAANYVWWPLCPFW